VPQLLKAIQIFAERDYLFVENEGLNEHIQLLQRENGYYESMITAQKRQIDATDEAMKNYEQMQRNYAVMVESLKRQVADEQKSRWRYYVVGGAAGIIVGGVIIGMAK